MHSLLLERDDCVVVVIDVQEKLMKVIDNRIVDTIGILLQAANIVGVPIIITEQYPKGLGHTLGDIRAESVDSVIEKTSFSASDVDSFNERLRLFGRSNVIICGVESHICVLQTVLGIGPRTSYRPILAADAIASRKAQDTDLAIHRMRTAGVDIVSVKMILFEWLRDAENPDFKALSRLIR